MADARGATKISFRVVDDGEAESQLDESVVLDTSPISQVTESGTSASTQSQPGDPEPPMNTSAQSSPPSSEDIVPQRCQKPREWHEPGF